MLAIRRPVGDIEVPATFAAHGVSHPSGPDAEALGYLIRGSRRIYFADPAQEPTYSPLAAAIRRKVSTGQPETHIAGEHAFTLPSR